MEWIRLNLSNTLKELTLLFFVVMKRSEAPAIMYIVFDANGNTVTATENESEAYQKEPSGGRVVTYTKG